ncbi:hypothetical protein HN011_000484 [Eciton burchellii]|nr:hypothetical protein HN011_000484 [Eciton burchellii]
MHSRSLYADLRSVCSFLLLWPVASDLAFLSQTWHRRSFVSTAATYVTSHDKMYARMKNIIMIPSSIARAKQSIGNNEDETTDRPIKLHRTECINDSRNIERSRVNIADGAMSEK